MNKHSNHSTLGFKARAIVTFYNLARQLPVTVKHPKKTFSTKSLNNVKNPTLLNIVYMLKTIISFFLKTPAYLLNKDTFPKTTPYSLSFQRLLKKNIYKRISYKPIPTTIVAITVLLLTSCSSTSVFRSYTDQANIYKNAITENNTEKVVRQLDKKVNSADKILYLCERGRINQLNNNIDASIEDFYSAMQAYEALDQKGIISLTGTGAQGASLFSNDNALPYKGYAFERIFLHQFQTFNYLTKNNIQAATVELRRAAVEQRAQELAHEKEIAKAEIRARNEKAFIPPLDSAPEFIGMDILSGNVKTSFQNAYIFYTSAVIWEALGDRNAALVNYKKALELDIKNKDLQADVKRVDNNKWLTANESVLVILYEDGFIPERLSFRLNIPDCTNKMLWSVAFPYYSTQKWYTPQPISVKVNGDLKGKTKVIANFGNMAVKALKENIPLMIIRQILRARTKYEISKQAYSFNNLVGLGSLVYTAVSEQADVRNWLTLPNNAQVKRIKVEPREHQVELILNDTVLTIPIKCHAKHTTILRVFNLNNHLRTQQFNL